MSSNASFRNQPRELVVDIRLDDDPRYKGSMHDDVVARARGYKAALVPGAFVYGHISRMALETWGSDWIRRGGMEARFRRPVYNGDRLTIHAGRLGDDPAMRRAQVSVSNGDGEEVATGWIGLPDKVPAMPDISHLSLIPRPHEPFVVAAGQLQAGMGLATADRVLTIDDFQSSLRAFGESDPFYGEQGIVHSGCLMRLAMGDTNNSYRFPSPVVLARVEARHFGEARPGQRLAIVGRVSSSYLRKGKHYFESEEFMTAGGRLVARFLRTQVYAYEDVSR